MTVLVITAAFIVITQHLIGFIHLFKVLFSILVIWILVRMKLQGQLSVCFFYLILGSRPAYTKNLVIFSLHNKTSKFS